MAELLSTLNPFSSFEPRAYAFAICALQVGVASTCRCQESKPRADKRTSARWTVLTEHRAARASDRCRHTGARQNASLAAICTCRRVSRRPSGARSPALQAASTWPINCFPSIEAPIAGAARRQSSSVPHFRGCKTAAMKGGSVKPAKAPVQSSRLGTKGRFHERPFLAFTSLLHHCCADPESDRRRRALHGARGFGQRKRPKSLGGLVVTAGFHPQTEGETMTAIVYQQQTGKLSVFVMANQEDVLGICYSGIGKGLNNPVMEAVPDVGPIPCGDYLIGKPHFPVNQLGPMAYPLTPMRGTDTHGRAGFYLHGDSAACNHTASHGCIIAAHDIRVKIGRHVGEILSVVPGPAIENAPPPAPAPAPAVDPADALNAAELEKVS